MMQPASSSRMNIYRITHCLTFCLALSLVGLCTSEALVSSSTSFLPRSLRARGGSTAATSGAEDGSKTSMRKPMTCVLQVPPSTSLKGLNGEGGGGDKNIKLSVKKSNGVAAKTPKKSNGTDREDIDAIVPAEYIAETKLPTDVGQFQLRAYRVAKGSNEFMGNEPCVIYSPDKSPFGKDGTLAEGVPVRIHDQCLTSEVFRSQRCDCKEQLKMSLEYIQKNGGAILYLQQEGRGIGLANKVAAYALQDDGFDTVDANLHLGFAEDCRQYGVVPSILSDLKIGSIKLMTNNPRKVARLEALGVNVEDTVPVVVPKSNPFNRKYLETKVDRMNHANLDPVIRNGGMVPARSIKDSFVTPIAETFVNNGEEMAANAVKVSLLDDTAAGTANDNEEKAGVSARDDGYCFGRESVEEAIEAIGRGEMVVVVDDMNRENEGDFIMAADLCSPKDMATIVRYSSGVVCIGMEGKRMDELKLPAMLTNNEDPKGTAFSVTVDATKEHGITTGISAGDRAKTMRLLADPESTALDFARPGHIFPLRAREGGVLTRDGHTEAAVDLARLAGRAPAGVLCEIVSEENPAEMARLPELKRFCKKHGYVLTSIVDLAQYRRETELVEKNVQ